MDALDKTILNIWIMDVCTMLKIDRYIGVALIVVERRDGTNAVLMYQRRSDGLWDFPCGTTDNGTARRTIVASVKEMLGITVMPMEQIGDDYIFKTSDGKVVCLQTFPCRIKDGELIRESELVQDAQFLDEEGVKPETGRRLWDTQADGYSDGITPDILENAFHFVDGELLYDDDGKIGHLGDNNHAAAV